MDWSDLRHFLAVARAGATNKAARELGVNHTTCARRIAALESALGLPLFEHGRDGYRLTERGSELLPYAERVEAEVRAFCDAASAGARRIAGTIRVTTNSSFADAILVPAVRDLRRTVPDVRIEIMIADRRLDIASGEADVGLRAGPPPTDPCLIARNLGRAAWGVFASPDYLARNSAPRDLPGLATHPLLLLDRPCTFNDRLPQLVPRPDIAGRFETMTDLVTAARAGLGVAGLPLIIGDSDPVLERCLRLDVFDSIWLVYHERHRAAPHMRAFFDCVLANLRHARPRLLGSDQDATQDTAIAI